ncbi:ribonuclease HII [Deltaproteobacteria bacterium]|nr:ribonuclease HII [Deltaproteobacteria bacterium]
MVACAVILPPGHGISGLADSKALSAKTREVLAPLIKARATAWGLGLVWPRRIDSINILQATFEAMSRAVGALRATPTALLIDGDKTLPSRVLAPHWLAGHHDHCPVQKAIVKGDKTIDAISAASILAKTFRDKLMRSLARRWPGYGFELHKGYGTKAHFAALCRLGPCPQHRLTFRGVAEDTKQTPRRLSLW